MNITNEFLEELNKLIAKRDDCVEHLEMFDDDDENSLDDFHQFSISKDYDNWYARKCSVDSDIKTLLDQLNSDDFMDVIHGGLAEFID